LKILYFIESFEARRMSTPPDFEVTLFSDRIVPLAMERAIREIITPVVDRSVTIACMTTRELVMKVCLFMPLA
jgi:hypothetical protein